MASFIINKTEYATAPLPLPVAYWGLPTVGMVSKDPNRRANSLALFSVPLLKTTLRNFDHTSPTRSLIAAHAIWLFPLHGPVSLRESPEHKSCNEHCNQH